MRCALALLVLAGAARAAAAQPVERLAEPDRAAENAAPEQVVDFTTQVEPILQAHCHRCHGPEMQSSGLRLDTRDGAERGGDSGLTVLGGNLASSELWARVSSSDRNFRMPKNAPRLADDEIEILRRWVAQSTPWPESLPAARSGGTWIESFAAFTDHYQAEYDYALPFAIGFVVLQVLSLVVIRSGAAYRAQKPWAVGRLAPFCRFAAGVRSGELVLVMLLGIGVMAFAAGRGRVLKLEEELATRRTQVIASKSRWVGTIYGFPPKPVRPRRPNQIAGTYYRGNCERDAELFNGGNYLTAIFRVSLCDDEHRQLEVGQEVPAGGLLMRVELERAPGTTHELFADSMISSIFLAGKYYESPDNLLEEQPAQLETLEPDRRWVAYVPIGSPEASDRLDGVVYLYVGQIQEGRADGSLHYAVQYELRFADGKVSPQSNVWMGDFGNAAFVDPVPPERLPHDEWFGEVPIPPITGKNSDDPKLLGIEEYVNEGLVDPPDVPSAKTSAEPDAVESDPQ